MHERTAQAVIQTGIIEIHVCKMSTVHASVSHAETSERWRNENWFNLRHSKWCTIKWSFPKPFLQNITHLTIRNSTNKTISAYPLGRFPLWSCFSFISHTDVHQPRNWYNSQTKASGLRRFLFFPTFYVVQKTNAQKHEAGGCTSTN